MSTFGGGIGAFLGGAVRQKGRSPLEQLNMYESQLDAQVKAQKQMTGDVQSIMSGRTGVGVPGGYAAPSGLYGNAGSFVSTGKNYSSGNLMDELVRLYDPSVNPGGYNTGPEFTSYADQEYEGGR